MKREALAFKGNPGSSTVLNTLDNLLAKEKKAAGQLFKSEQDSVIP